MSECEKKGTGGLKAHNAILKGEIHNLTIINHYNYIPSNNKISRRIQLKLYSNTTFWELRCKIS